MKSGIVLNAGWPADIVASAAAAEAAGWDGVFTYDAIEIGGTEMYDPWALLAAMAMRTSRVTLGAIVFAPTRRRPWKLAREALTVDHLSNGRLVLPVGLGALDDLGFGNVGEIVATRERAAILDEALAILDGLWTGEPFEHHGAHFDFGPMTFLPRPVQRPRVPIWVVGAWPHERSIERALHWDGVVLQTDDVAEVRDIVAFVGRRRTELGESARFDVVVQGRTDPDPEAAAAAARPYAEAGATWWIDADWSGISHEQLAARIAAGPPRVS
jgi:alkanesulfonate monooxygenase SsuD/methylene tetrahydromethanopterin reductase-like flavin-dependent oxidoreductase (luciferase family)